jgi:hypothetical protein
MNKPTKTSVPTKTKVTKSVGHDRLSVSAKFPTGGVLRFSISRAGERLTVGLSNDRETLLAQSRKISAWVALRSGETNGQRIDRLAAICERCGSGAELMLAIAK